MNPESKEVLHRFLRNRLACMGVILMIVLAGFSLLAPVATPYTYDEPDPLLGIGATPPSARHWFGTDVLGRDLFTRVLYGGRTSLMVGICATAVSLVIGVTYGSVSGYCGARTDTIMMRIVDILYALPFTIFVIILTVVFGRNIFLLFAVIGAVEWLTMARIIRGQVLAIRQQEFVQAAVVLGYSKARIIFRHILPNALGPIIVYTTLTIPQVILLESFISFLGLGVQLPQSSWGLLIKTGAESMESYPWLLIYPGAVLSLALFALNFVGDGLRDALDPRHTRRA
ncbi:MAG: ABC transporter permease [Verrucomicrobia bacterium]|nr:ABC transporter permease [Verrucomicrobiota bacterium]MDA1086535.1 ABC transporter permease [Verrucomicrobiota bacterium]